VACRIVRTYPFSGVSTHDQRDSPDGARERPVIRSMPLRRPCRPPGQRIRHRENLTHRNNRPLAGLLALHSRRPGTLTKLSAMTAFQQAELALPWHHADGVTLPGQPRYGRRHPARARGGIHRRRACRRCRGYTPGFGAFAVNAQKRPITRLVMRHHGETYPRAQSSAHGSLADHASACSTF
jgi:hypothetical protein